MHIDTRYIAALTERGITPDASQQTALRALSQLAHALEAPSFTAALLRPLHLISSPKGLYFWGGVGRGKTLLMDVFYNTLQVAHKKRMHFHDFMHTIHAQLRDHAGQSNPLQTIAKEWRRECVLLCLDECTVDDVADALILGELLKSFFKMGIVLVTTSNTRTDKLYEKGVQRQLFLKAIDAIMAHCDIVHVDNGEDYRHRALPHEATYVPESREQDMEALFDRLATGTVQRNQDIIIDERPIRARAIAHRIIWFDFQSICMTFRSTPDYLTLVKQYDTFFITHVPVLHENDVNATRRFVHLIDVLYDHHANLVLSAAVDVSQIYQGEMLKPEFMRTQSRLTEMLSRL
ncbi:MAG: cell division protein ZapE [Gammaproteobacteria bacterium]